MTKIIDISLPIFTGMPVYPGTAETSISSIKSASGTAVLSEITMTSHAGTHIDAPVHAIEGAKGIDDFSLETFYGPCRVIDVSRCTIAITVDDLKPLNLQQGERLLFKTNNSLRGFETFYNDYVYLNNEAAEYLASINVLLVGLDALSVKQRGAADNTAHTALLTKNIPIIEGLNLAHVEAGEYTLCAFPLAFKDIDGSPARVILLN